MMGLHDWSAPGASVATPIADPDKAREQARRAREQATEWVDRGNDVINQQKERFRSAYEAGRQAYNETTAGPEPAKNI